MKCSGCSSEDGCSTGGCGKLSATNWIADIHIINSIDAFDKVEVVFKGGRKDYYINENKIYLDQGDIVTVETTSGKHDMGHVNLTGELVRTQLKAKNIALDNVKKKVLRKSTDEEIEKWKAIKAEENRKAKQAQSVANSLSLKMKISDVDFQSDGTKATFYYTSLERVDFRELIKHLAEKFSVKVEMRQIGARQETARIGGMGACGRELCCSTWLTKFKSVNTQAVRYQNLSLNTSKLSGQCGKLKCCLNYELEVYLDALKEIPQKFKQIKFKEGTAKRIKTDIFQKKIWFSVGKDEEMFYIHSDEVKHLLALNAQGHFPDMTKYKKTEEIVSKEINFEVVTEGSLERFSKPKKKKKRKKREHAH